MLTTRCPHCGTAFRVKPEQLRLRGGRVRCGHCQAPFSALESLIDAPEKNPSSALAEASAPAAPETLIAPSSFAPNEAKEHEPSAEAAIGSREEAPQTSSEKPFVLAAPEALPSLPGLTRAPFTSGWTPPPKRETFISSAGEIAPPLPELDPSTPQAPSPRLDFDLDALEPEPAPPSPEPKPAPPLPEPEPAPEPSLAPNSDNGVETVLGWDWNAPTREPSAPPEPEQPQPSPFKADATLVVDAINASTESIEPTAKLAPTSAADPLFVSSFAGAELNQVEDWESVSPGEPALFDDDDTLFEPPEAVTDAFVSPPPSPASQSATPSSLPPFSALDNDTPHPYSWEAEREAQPKRWPWALATLLLAFVGAAQGLLLMRHDIAQQIPAVRPAFEMACAKLGCAMPWPRIKEQISIEASDLHPRPGHLGQYELSGTLRNRAAFAQAYPHLEITLTDNFNRALVRKVLPPEQWLPAAQRKSPAFEASSDLAFTITFEALGQSAAGYTLSSFYP